MITLSNVYFLVSNDLSPVSTRRVSQAYGNKDQMIVKDTFNKYKKKGKEKFLKISAILFDLFYRDIHAFQQFNRKSINDFTQIINNGIPITILEDQTKIGSNFRKQLNVNDPMHLIIQILYKLQHHKVKLISRSYTISKSPSARGFRHGFIKEFIKHCSGKKGTALYNFLYTIGEDNGMENNYNLNNNNKKQLFKLYNKSWQQGWRNGFDKSIQGK